MQRLLRDGTAWLTYTHREDLMQSFENSRAQLLHTAQRSNICGHDIEHTILGMSAIQLNSTSERIEHGLPVTSVKFYYNYHLRFINDHGIPQQTGGGPGASLNTSSMPDICAVQVDSSASGVIFMHSGSDVPMASISTLHCLIGNVQVENYK